MIRGCESGDVMCLASPGASPGVVFLRRDTTELVPVDFRSMVAPKSIQEGGKSGFKKSQFSKSCTSNRNEMT